MEGRDLFFDGELRIGGYIDELDADAHTRQAIADFAPSSHENIRMCQAEFNGQD